MEDSSVYALNCLDNGRKISGKKFKALGGDIESYPEIYLTHNKNLRPTCAICAAGVKFRGFSLGFRKYCSKTCANSALSARNTLNNYELNSRRSIKTQIKHKNMLYGVQDIVEKMFFDDKPIIEISRAVELPRHIIAQFCADTYSSNINRGSKLREISIQKKFKDINSKLEDAAYIQRLIDKGLGGKEISVELECSPNYVYQYLRNLGRPLKSNYSSYPENLVESILRNSVEYIKNDRKMISPFELDFYIPEHNFAIEVNGRYWHSSERKDKYYHKNKTEMAERLGIHILHLHDTEIIEKFDVVSSMILEILNKSRRIDSQECSIRVLSENIAYTFIKNNNIQEIGEGLLHLSLVRKGEIMAVMTFREYGKSHFELTRYTTLINSTITDGMTKLISHFVNHYKPNSFFAICPNRLYDGKEYVKSGATEVGSTSPSCQLVGKKDVLEIGNKMTKFDDYIQVYDCGSTIYYWSTPNAD